jgi:hypothetical protein
MRRLYDYHIRKISNGCSPGALPRRPGRFEQTPQHRVVRPPAADRAPDARRPLRQNALHRLSEILALATGMNLRVAREDLFDERRTGPDHADNEDDAGSGSPQPGQRRIASAFSTRATSANRRMSAASS